MTAIQQSFNQQSFKEEQLNTVAFVLCHSINSTLSPISKELPPCLFPLCNTPTLFYTLNWLNCNEVNKIYLICQESHTNIIRKYIHQWQNINNLKPIEILSVSEQNYQINSVGDSIRWIYSSSSVVLNFKNFIIVPGTLVTNVPLGKIIKEHENRMKKPKKNQAKPIMTTIFTKAKLNGYSVLLENDGSIIQLSIPEINFDNKKDQLPFKKTKTTRIKTNLKDSQIYICSPELMGLFASDNNFDWNSVIDDCVPSIIDCEFDKKSVNATILQNSFSSDVNNYQNYIDSTLAVIHGILSPCRIDANLSSPSRSYSLLFDNNEYLDNTSDTNDDYYDYDEEYEELTDYKLKNNYVYIDDDEVSISKSAVIDHSVVVGRGCKIEDGCIIKNSVLGSYCTIKKGSVIENTIIWDGVTLEENVHVNNSLIASDVLIKKDVKIEFGCIISFKSVVDGDLPPCRRLTSRKIGDNNEKEVEFRADVVPDWLKNYIHNKTPLKLTNNNNSCFEYVPCPESEIPSLYLWYQISPNSFPIDISIINNDDYEIENNEEKEINMKSYESEFLISLDTKFLEEAKDLLSNLLNNSTNIDQIYSEFVIFKNAKYAENIDCAISIVLAISKHWPITELKDGFSFLKKLFNVFLSDVENQENLLFWWQEYCAKSQKRTDLFNHGLDSFIELGSVSNQAIECWKSEQEECNEAQLNLLKQYRPHSLFI